MESVTVAVRSSRASASYSMFSRAPQRPQRGVNSPPPLPHRDYHQEAADANQDAQHMDLDHQQVRPSRAALCRQARQS